VRPRGTSGPFSAGAALCALWMLLLAGCADDSCDPDFTSSCPEQQACAPTPSSCRTSVPSSGELVVRVSHPPPVLVRVYRGTAYETGTLVWSGLPQGDVWSITVPLGSYSATALYVSAGDSVLTVDGDDVGYAATSTCDANCYSSEDGAVDLELE
jgi:hypothetical protein